MQLVIESDGKRELIETPELKPETSVQIDAFKKDLLVVKDASGEVYAIENYCPHAIQKLADGEVIGSMIKCKKHGAVFSLVDGRCIGNERIGNLNKYSVSEVDGAIIIKL
ncbi:Rieske 2Fe-2S domain-containing protein [Spongiibacter nanhainus]|uniref:Rieske 2Fe-2S domain-containing protein n=1 Tax=Spongiibacter nanhainus TaxID=2794344 RepID=A0A7T4UT01_9GAMM|nr:Rieske 2Fe-2S domain-containing protein [Spongiibacter nanhainus]QQD19955.1 Rieske 2Fe-2S domain-containing protein [Spongiibacter nanhainus]